MTAISIALKNMTATVLLIMLGVCALSLADAVAQTPRRSKARTRSHNLLPSHGTINVFLGNKNGLIVLTDSKLSDENHRAAGKGEKLFRLNDRTVCSIAGWYFDPGPAVQPNGGQAVSYPVQLAVPDVMETITSSLRDSRRGVQAEFDTVSELFSAILSQFAYIEAIAGKPSSQSDLEITVAGYDFDGELKIVMGDLVPDLRGDQIAEYDVVNRKSIDVPGPKGFVKEFRGIRNTANAIVDGTDTSVRTDLTLQDFKRSLDSGTAKSLSLDDLKQIAGAIEWQTSKEYPNLVGGLLQTAVLTNGHVLEFDEPVSPSFHIPRSAFIFMSDDTYVAGPTDSPRKAIGIRLDTAAVVFLNRVTITNVIQPLDNLIVFDSSFAHCHLAYSGSPRTMFDKSNSLADTDLILLPGAEMNSEFVKQIKRDFPALRIIDHTESPMTGTGVVIDVRG